jgi:hypothetical protein
MFWQKYHDILFKYLDLQETYNSSHTHKDIEMKSILYSGEHILKSRVTDISQGITTIYNNIIYPKTGSNLPCFGMDLMAFFEKKVILTFDFQHPREYYDFDHEIIRENMGEYAGNTKEIRFFEPGNHFSRYVYVRKCHMNEVEQFLPDFETYVATYAKILEAEKPTGHDTSEYELFDKYMLELDPVSGYMSSTFGKEFGEKYVHDFLFEYANMPL